MDELGSSNLEGVIEKIWVSARDLKKKLETLNGSGNVNGNGITNSNGVKNIHEYMELHKASQKMKQLQKENIELRQALEDHQYGLEFIMNKYRSHVGELTRLNSLEKGMPRPQPHQDEPHETVSSNRNNNIE